MEHVGDAEPEAVPSERISWALEQARYLMSETMEAALSQRPYEDPMRVEVAQTLSILAGEVLAEGAEADARRACEVSVAHLRLVQDADGHAEHELAGVLHNLALLRLQTEGDEGRVDGASLAAEALRWISSAPVPDEGDDVELLVAVASLAVRTRVGLDATDPQLIADLGDAADRSVRPPAAATETLRDLGVGLTTLATAQARREQVVESSDLSQAAAIVYRTLASREPERYGPDLATALKNCAVLDDRMGRSREAAGYAHDAARWFERASEHGGPQEDARAAMLVLEARSLRAIGAYSEAERPALEAELVYRRLLDSDQQRYAGALQTTLSLLELARSGAN